MRLKTLVGVSDGPRLRRGERTKSYIHQHYHLVLFYIWYPVGLVSEPVAVLGPSLFDSSARLVL